MCVWLAVRPELPAMAGAPSAEVWHQNNFQLDLTSLP